MEPSGMALFKLLRALMDEKTLELASDADLGKLAMDSAAALEGQPPERWGKVLSAFLCSRPAVLELYSKDDELGRRVVRIIRGHSTSDSP